MAHIRITVYDVRPSGHTLKAWRGDFSCRNSTKHKKDIIKFLDQLKKFCPSCMNGAIDLQTLIEVIKQTKMTQTTKNQIIHAIDVERWEKMGRKRAGENQD